MTARLTPTQRAALMKLIDGEWHSLAEFTTNTRMALLNRMFIDQGSGAFSGFGRDDIDYRITDAGRAALGATP